jgi:hypothetical protein
MTSLINPCSVESHHALPMYFAAAVSSTRSPRYRSPATKAQVRRSAFAKWAGERLEKASKPLSQEPLSEELLDRVLLEGEAILLQRWQGAQQGGGRVQTSVVVHTREGGIDRDHRDQCESACSEYGIECQPMTE